MLLLLDCVFTACSTTVARNVPTESSPKSQREGGSQSGREWQREHAKDLDIGYESMKKGQ